MMNTPDALSGLASAGRKCHLTAGTQTPAVRYPMADV